MIRVTCSECGKEFETNVKNKLTCSFDCRMARQHRREKEHRHKMQEALRNEVTCPICGKTFLKQRTQRYCSKACSAQAHKNFMTVYNREYKKATSTKAAKGELTPAQNREFLKKANQKEKARCKQILTLAEKEQFCRELGWSYGRMQTFIDQCPDRKTAKQRLKALKK